MWVAAAAVFPVVAPDTAVPDMRIFVLRDADVMSDAFLGNDYDATLFVDVIHWLGGEERSSAVASTTEHVRVEHTKQGDLVFFYGTIVLVPTLLLGLRLFSTRRAQQPRG
jgi:hypothetical protein